MNCAQFELIAGDIAAGRRELAGPAWVHAARCADCQERLFAERNLQSTLSGLRRELVAERPPDEMELALVRRFSPPSPAVAPPAGAVKPHPRRAHQRLCRAPRPGRAPEPRAGQSNGASGADDEGLTDERCPGDEPHAAVCSRGGQPTVQPVHSQLPPVSASSL